MSRWAGLILFAIVSVFAASAPASAQNPLIGSWTSSAADQTGRPISATRFTFFPNGQYQAYEVINNAGPGTAGGTRTTQGIYQFNGRRLAWQIVSVSWCVNGQCGPYPYASGPRSGAFDVQVMGNQLYFQGIMWSRAMF